MISRWNTFWFEEKPSNLLCLLRLFFGLWIVLRGMGWWGPFQRIHKWKQPGWPAAKQNEALWAGEYTPPLPGFEWLPHAEWSAYQGISQSVTFLGLLMMVGLGWRIVGPLVLMAYAYPYLGTTNSYSHHSVMMILTLLCLAFAPASDHYSLDAVIRRRLQPGWVAPERSVLFLRLFQCFIVILYCSTTFGKLNTAWFNGWVIEKMDRPRHLTGYWAKPTYDLLGPVFISWYTVFAEGLVALGIWNARLRMPAIAAGVALHFGIDFMMPVTTFSYQMMTSYIAFLDPVPARNIVRYDKSSAWQRAGAGLARALNWLDRLKFEASSEFEIVLPDGRNYRGPRGVVEAGLLLPMTFPLCFVLGLPRTLWGRPRPPQAPHEMAALVETNRAA